MRITDCNVYNLRASAVVEEEGTGVTFSAGSSVNVMRTAVNFETVYVDNYKKPNLPYTLKVKRGTVVISDDNKDSDNDDHY